MNLELAVRSPAVLPSVTVAEHPMAFGGMGAVQLLAEGDGVLGEVVGMDDLQEARVTFRGTDTRSG
jgi:hypothetical protein